MLGGCAQGLRSQATRGIWHREAAGKASLWGWICSAKGSGFAKHELLGEVCLCPQGSHVPAGVRPGVFQHQLRRSKLPARTPLPPTTLLPPSSFTQQKPPGCGSPSVVQRHQPRSQEGAGPPPATSPLSSLGDQHHEAPRSPCHVGRRMMSCPRKLLFCLGEVRSPLREAHGSVCEL